MGRFYAASAAIAVLISASLVSAEIPTCGPNKLCPAETPCCSAYGQCGVGAYCLGGCDPLFSHSLESCVPNPICKSQDYNLNSLDDIAPNTRYLGDASKAKWVSSGQPVAYQNEAVLLTMAPDTVGTLLATTNYVWYGKISATMTTSQGKGVVTAFIMMSDVKDEIDFEFVGIDVENAQSNYYSQGVTNYNNGRNLSTSNTVTNTHTYTIDWTPEKIDWQIDGKTLRTVERQSTWNATANRYDYPQTPARVMLSLWPAGLPSNAPGTINWAGGLVDWDSPYMQNGYYYALVNNVKVECYDPPKGASVQGSKSYKYTDKAGTNDTVVVTDDVEVLASFFATGEDPEKNPNAAASKSSSAASTKTGSAAAESTSAEVETVPGLSGAGARGEEGGPAAVVSQAPGSSVTQPAAGSLQTAGGSGGTGFSQGDTQGQSGAAGKDRRVVGGSGIAFVGALVGLLVL
ncbi:putative glycosidase CRH2 [Coniosporium apollinis]|uniref:Crh-like protein n=1 Tax=Coniosporium apollinis TaxID=61459 RepID=A0ABQ9NZ00_9PEZI|nr:putative glycosidase CRH2 [Coniosporium apollinis]